MTKQQIQQLIEGSLSASCGVSPAEANDKQMYNALALVIKNILLQKRKIFNHNFKSNGQKRVYYLSMEFLLGRSLKNNLFNLGLTQEVSQVLSDLGFDLNNLYEQESDAGLGNGGLGRLASCYMDALASLGYPACGHCLRYEYGIFQQKLIDGWQTELPDNWLPGGAVWLTERPDKAVTVRFGGRISEQWRSDKMVLTHVDYQEVEAVPYDLMISGYDSQAVSVLRLWASRNKRRFDMRAFSQGEYLKAMQEDAEAEIITKVLYPADNNVAGKSLRLKQQYLLTSSAVQDIVADHLKYYKDMSNFDKVAAIHLNDTHPVLAILELMRIMLDEQGFDWEKAWGITTATCSYTNHTILSEALEIWGEDLFQRLLPRLYDIAKEVNKRQSQEMWQKSNDWKKVSATSVIAYDQIRMANLAVVGSHSINGVSALHSQILKSDLFADFAEYYPDKFINITNGIACRRWLCQANPRLTALLNDTIGQEYITDFSKLSQFNKFANDNAVLDRLAEIKLANKIDFCNSLSKHGIIVDPNSRFDVQAKRLHEYKRQLLNAIRIVSLYCQLKNDANMVITPQTFIFGAKAASSYYMAKEIIKLIYKLGKLIEKDKRISQMLRVVFLENYSVTIAEQLMPSAEVSQQISLAGKEASGTGNMKFMLNGAITLGTLDGANVEIAQELGNKDIFIFGMTAQEVSQKWKEGYNSMEYYFVNDQLRQAIDLLSSGIDKEDFSVIKDYLLKDNLPDPYMCLADFDSYNKACLSLDKAYLDKTNWNKMCLHNIACSGIFSADRAIEQYAKQVWNLKPI
ncbi:MAG: glycogen/starch/alpha-glucan phosphorylase [Clostridia bacterium]